jgi:hypothetical protein
MRDSPGSHVLQPLLQIVPMRLVGANSQKLGKRNQVVVT